MASLLRRAATRHAHALARPRTRHAPPPPRLHLQTRAKRTTAAKKGEKAAISRTIANNEAASIPVNDKGEPVLIFGLRPIDYRVRPPIRNPPPPPPPKPGLQKYLFPLTLVITAATVGYFYVNNKNDNYEYWRAMQSGEAMVQEEYEDDEEEEEEEVEEAADGDASEASQKKGWFGWLRRRKQGGGDEAKPEPSR